MKTLLIALGLLYTLPTFSQSFDEHMGAGDKFYQEEKFLESAKAYTKAFQIKEGTAGAYYNAACSWALSGDTINSMEYLNIAVDKGFKNIKHLKKDQDLKGLHSLQSWEGLLNKLQAVVDEYQKDFNKPLMKQLEEIYVRDQTLRQLYGEAEEKFGNGSEEMDYFWKIIGEQDRLNEAEVMEIIDEHGWVGTSLVGGQANTALWLVIQHAPIEVQEKYLPLLKESVLAGESKGGHLALLEDRIQMRNGKPQTYGSQITSDEKTGDKMVYEIWEPEYVNQRRKEVGLGPIENYVQRWGIEWTIPQKEK